MSPTALLTEDTTVQGITDNQTEPTTPVPQPQLLGSGLSEDIVITLSVLVPTLVCLGMSGGCYCYIQYRKKKGLSYGCIPVKKKDKKLKDSDENVNVSTNSGKIEEPPIAAAAAAASLGPSVSTLADKIDQIGATGGVEDDFEEVELYTAHPTSPSILAAVTVEETRLPPPIPERKNPPPAVPQRIPPGPREPDTPVRSRQFYPREAKGGARPKYGGNPAVAKATEEDDDIFDFDPAMTAARAQDRI